MSDSQGPKSKNIPSWQQQETSSPSPPPEHAQQQQQQPSESRTSLIEIASEFLKDESIRDAPIERKKLFLESKGLSQAEIDNLLEIQHTPEAAVVEENEASKSIPYQPPSASSSTPPNQHPPPSTPLKYNDHPPIITYPEFLLHAQKPAPLITANRLLTSLYVFTGTVAIIYETSTYFIEPMLSNLTSARHSLFTVAGTNIDTLNKNLESAVSKVPHFSPPRKEQEEENKNDDDNDDADTESIPSADGARFFQRSAGTQTSPRRPLSPSRSSSSIASDPAATEPTSPAQEHTSALSKLHSKLSDLLPPTTTTTTNGETTNPLKDSISELRAYLEKLPYANSVALGNKKARKKGEVVVDAVANVKAEIRGVKGVLLSARNFPSGVVAR